jgi:hypothetical protein
MKMIRRGVMLLLLLVFNNIMVVPSVAAEILSRDVVGCNNWEWFLELIWLKSLEINGIQYIEAAETADKWISSGKCTRFSKGTSVIVIDRLPLRTIQVRLSGSLLEYIMPDDALIEAE